MTESVPSDAGMASGTLGAAPVRRVASVRRLSDTLRSLWIWAGTALVLLLWLPVIALRRMADRTPAHRATSALVRRLNLFINRVNPLLRVRVEGFSNLRPGICYLVVCNHQSLADIPLLARMPFPLKWVAKKDLFRVPVTGWIMRMAGDIPVSRGVPGNREAVLARAGEYLREGVSVLFFPEGRRTGTAPWGG
ncbi:MAG: lysophospholipid acyltransferase family protein [Kiritimatiellia bacterium]